jgi:hypothetical protein
MKSKYLLAILVLVLSTLACALGNSEPADPNLLFKDDFSSTSSGWDVVDGDTGSTSYQNEQYRIYVTQTQYDVWANPGLTTLPADVRVEVDASKASGPDVNDFGVICRYTEVGDQSNPSYNFYYFMISSDGYAAIGKVKDSQQDFITDLFSEPVPAIKLGETNRIRGDCVGNTLTMYVNGEQILSIEDSDLTGGDVGLLAGTFDEAGTEILFDNFLVTKP